jgi:protein required for attachment to host cells
MKKKWIVVAESSRARIFSVESRSTPLKEVEDMVHVASRLHDQDLVTDMPGRSFDSHGSVGRHAMESKTEPKKAEVMHFAHDVSERLENARRVGDYNDLVLISSPGFLGMLKQTLGNVTQKHISQTINKNLIHKSEAEIRHYLFQ